MSVLQRIMRGNSMWVGSLCVINSSRCNRSMVAMDHQTDDEVILMMTIEGGTCLMIVEAVDLDRMTAITAEMEMTVTKIVVPRHNEVTLAGHQVAGGISTDHVIAEVMEAAAVDTVVEVVVEDVMVDGEDELSIRQVKGYYSARDICFVFLPNQIVLVDIHCCNFTILESYLVLLNSSTIYIK
mmetsp:Transcript_19652/g.29162  ORF Transcript_19652/g.29162 Transcript_19652/m.29162 type:complete len:183 (+) Transcript_19652:1214-1762(+)